MVESEQLLLTAKSELQRAKRDYRDARLRVGDLMHRYLTVRLQEAHHMTEAERVKAGLTREKMVAGAARRLEVPSYTLHEILRVAAVVRVLSDDGKIGELSYQSLRHLSVLVKRMFQDYVRGEPPASAMVWVAKECNIDTKGFFRRAIDEGWGTDRVKCEMSYVNVARLGGRKRKRQRDQNQKSDLFVMARAASPKDLASLLQQLISMSENPTAVIELLREGLYSEKHN